jgi:hypothetical protein
MSDFLKSVPVYTLRPVFAFPGLAKPVLLVSFEDAVRVLGEGWAGTLHHVFASGEGMQGVWALPHPDAHPPSEESTNGKT